MPKPPKTPRVAKEPRPKAANGYATGKVGRPLGWSSLSSEVQAQVEAELAAGGTLNGTARLVGASREQVRTIRSRMRRLEKADG